MRRRARHRGRWRRALAALLIAVASRGTPAAAAPRGDDAPMRVHGGRFTFIAYPGDAQLARALLADAIAADTFPWLPRPRRRVVIAIAPDRRRFREWGGQTAPEWGAALAFPETNRIVMQGHRAPGSAGDPPRVLRHELAHLALHEHLGELPPRWFDEGYAGLAAGEWGRDELLAANVALVLRGMPPLDSLDREFEGGATRAGAAYALAYRAVAELAALDERRGLTLFFAYWRETARIDRAIRAAFGITEAQFERRWRERTRARYGGLALFADLSLASLFLLLVMTPLYLVRRRRDRRRLEALIDADERAERLARESAIEQLLRTLPSSPHNSADDPA